MRDLTTVIERILNYIPETEEDLIYSLNKIKKSFLYSPPELYSMWWRKTYDVLCNYVFNDEFNENDWHGKVRRIYVGEE